MAKKKNSVQGLIGFEHFTSFGVKTDKAEIAFFSVEPTNISVLSEANIDVKIRYLMMLLSTVSDLEIIALDSCECFDSNKIYVKNRLQNEQNERVRKLLQADYSFLDEIQAEMSSACQFMFAIRFRREKDEQIFNTINRVDKAISEHADLFKNSTDDKALINAINSTYGLKIDYNEFMKSYTWIMNATINQYMFVDSKSKNAADLAAWAENAYISGWGYKDGTFGERDESDRIRYADSAGLILGYLRYDSEQKTFSSEPSSLHFTSKGGLDKMPDEAGNIMSDGSNYGVYIGDGEVVFASKESGCVTKEKVADGAWNSWSSISGAAYNTAIKFDEYDEKKKNNLGLVQWAIQAHEAGWGYIYGTYGNVLTESLLQDRAAVFGSEVTDYMDFIYQNWLGKRTADCVGLIKGYGWYDSASGEIRVGTNGMMDVGANAMLANATVKGTIDTIPEVPGLAVWVDGHIGIYIGNGEVIEAMNTLRGVTRTKLAGREWTHWLQIPYISYVQEK